MSINAAGMTGEESERRLEEQESRREQVFEAICKRILEASEYGFVEGRNYPIGDFTPYLLVRLLDQVTEITLNVESMQQDLRDLWNREMNRE